MEQKNKDQAMGEDVKILLQIFNEYKEIQYDYNDNFLKFLIDFRDRFKESDVDFKNAALEHFLENQELENHEEVLTLSVKFDIGGVGIDDVIELLEAQGVDVDADDGELTIREKVEKFLDGEQYDFWKDECFDDVKYLLRSPRDVFVTDKNSILKSIDNGNVFWVNFFGGMEDIGGKIDSYILKNDKIVNFINDNIPDVGRMNWDSNYCGDVYSISIPMEWEPDNLDFFDNAVEYLYYYCLDYNRLKKFKEIINDPDINDFLDNYFKYKYLSESQFRVNTFIVEELNLKSIYNAY